METQLKGANRFIGGTVSRMRGDKGKAMSGMFFENCIEKETSKSRKNSPRNGSFEKT